MTSTVFFCSAHREAFYDDTAFEMRAGAAQLAAAEFVEQNLANLDYPTEIDIYVKHERRGSKIEKYQVTVTSVPCATATLIEEQ